MIIKIISLLRAFYILRDKAPLSVLQRWHDKWKSVSQILTACLHLIVLFSIFGRSFQMIKTFFSYIKNVYSYNNVQIELTKQWIKMLFAVCYKHDLIMSMKYN